VCLDLSRAVAPAPDSPPDPEREARRPAAPSEGAGGRRSALRLAPGRVLALASTIPALVLTGWLLAAYPLVRAGVAAPLPALVAAVPVVAVLVSLARRLPPVPRAPGWAVLATLAICAAFAALAASRHAEHIVLRRDAGVYALTAHWLAHHGGLTIPTDLAAAGGPSPAFGIESPGFYQLGDVIVPQFMSGAALALMPGGWLAGWTGILTAPAVYAAAALLAAAGLVGRLVGPRWAPVGALVLGLTQPVMLSARSTLSEPTTQLLLLGGLCLLIDAVGTERTARASGRALAALAGLVIGFGPLVRIEAVRETLLLAPVIGWLAARRRPQWLPLTAGLAAGSSYALWDAVGPSWPYVSDLWHPLRALLALGAVLAAGSAATAVAVRRGAFRAHRAALARTALAGAGAVLVAGVAGFLFVRPWLQVTHFPVDQTTRILAGLQRDQGLPVDGTRLYAEQTLRWVSWYVGWPALAAAAVAATVLVWRTVRAGDDRWAVALPVLLASTALVLYRPGITPDHPWADRRLVPTVLPAVTLLAVCAVAATTRAARRRWAPAGRGGLVLAVAGAGIVLLVAPAVKASWPLAGARTEAGEPAAVRAACAAFGPGDVALLVDARTRQEWMPALRQVCGVPTFSVPGQPADDDATPAQVRAVVARVRSAGGRPVLVAQSGVVLPRLARAPQRRVAALGSMEHSRLLVRPADRLVPLSVELWIAAAD
jgi:hypothetical protein